MATIYDTGWKFPGTVTASGSGDCTWSNINNIKADDSNYASAQIQEYGTKFTDDMDATNFGFNIPHYAVVVGVEVRINRKRSSGDTTNDHFYTDNTSDPKRPCLIGTFGTSAGKTTAEWTTSDANEDSGSNSDTWGETLTWEVVNDSSFGFKIKAEIFQSFILDMLTAYVDFVQMKVYYTIPELTSDAVIELPHVQKTLTSDACITKTYRACETFEEIELYNSTDWTNPTVATDIGIGWSAWTNKDNIFSDDNNYATNSAGPFGGQTNLDPLVATGYGFSIQSYETVKGIEARLKRKALYNETDNWVRLYSVTGSYQGVQLHQSGSPIGTAKTDYTNWPTSEADADYGGSTDLWGATPNVNDSTFGIAVTPSVKAPEETPNTAYIDCIQAKVHYMTNGLRFRFENDYNDDILGLAFTTYANTSFNSSIKKEGDYSLYCDSGYAYFTGGLSTTSNPPFTVAMWVYPTAEHTAQLMQFGTYNSTRRSIGFRARFSTTDGYVYLRVPWDDHIIYYNFPALNRWYHMAMVFDNTTDTATFYVDGAAVGSATLAGDLVLLYTSVYAKFGLGINTGGDGIPTLDMPIQGYVDDYKFYFIKFTPEEVYALQVPEFASDAEITRLGITSTITSDASILTSYSEDISSDEFIKKSQKPSLTSNARIVSFPQKTITSDASIFKSYSVSIASDAFVSEEAVGSLPSISWIDRLEEAVLYSDAKIKKTYLKTLNSDANIFKEYSDGLNSNAFILKSGNDKTLTSDAEITYTQVQENISSDAWIFKTNTETIASDAEIYLTQMQQQINSNAYITGIAHLTSDAEISYTDHREDIVSIAYILYSAQQLLNGMARILKDTLKTINSNAKIKKLDNQITINSYAWTSIRYQKTISSTAMLLKITQKTINSRACIKKLDAQKTINSDAWIEEEQISGLTSLAFILKHTRETINSSARIKKSYFREITDNSWITKEVPVVINSNYRILQHYPKDINSDALIKKEDVETGLASNAFILKITPQTIVSDAMLLAPYIENILCDIVIFRDDTRQLLGDAWVKRIEPTTIDSNAMLLASYDKYINSDAYLLTSYYGTLNSDNFILKITDERLYSDAYILGEIEGGLLSDAYIKTDYFGTIDSDAYILKIMPEAIDADYMLLAETPQTIASDAWITGIAHLTSDALIQANIWQKSLGCDLIIAIPQGADSFNCGSYSETIEQWEFIKPVTYRRYSFWEDNMTGDLQKDDYVDYEINGEVQTEYIGHEIARAGEQVFGDAMLYIPREVKLRRLDPVTKTETFADDFDNGVVGIKWIQHPGAHGKIREYDDMLHIYFNGEPALGTDNATYVAYPLYNDSNFTVTIKHHDHIEDTFIWCALFIMDEIVPDSYTGWGVTNGGPVQDASTTLISTANNQTIILQQVLWTQYEYYRVRFDGLRYYFEVSNDGETWESKFQKTPAELKYTPKYIGMAVNRFGGLTGQPYDYRIDSFELIQEYKDIKDREELIGPTFRPQINDEVKEQGIWYRIKEIKPYNIGESEIAFECVLTKIGNDNPKGWS